MCYPSGRGQPKVTHASLRLRRIPPLLACRLMDVLGLPRTLVPPNPGNVSAFGLLTVDVRNDYVQTVVSRHADLDLSRVQSVFADLEAQAQAALDGEGFTPDQQ